jgi:hypothetical protein
LVYERSFAPSNAKLVVRASGYAVFGAVLSWSFTTIAVAAKNVMNSVPDYLLIETSFTIAQWVIVGPLTAWVLSSRPAMEPKLRPSGL